MGEYLMSNRHGLKSTTCWFVMLSMMGCLSLSGVAAEQAKNGGSAILKPNATVVIAGDSITEQKIYSRFIEAYLLACRPDLKLKVIQSGWIGETAPRFLARIDNDITPFNPDLVTICYGMNDGRYTEYAEYIGNAYATAMRGIVQKLKDKGITAIVGTPGCVDSDTFKKISANVYNENLKTLGEIDRKIAGDYSMPFADLHSAMLETMVKAKAAYGSAYYISKDGVHPANNGHLVMAYVFLKAMGLDGDIGTLAVDFNGKAEGDSAHKILSFQDGKLEVESSRYPFCFSGDDKTPDGTRSILPYLPFNRDLNRFMLIVKNLPSDKAEILWGTDKKTFTKEQLETGINLADEFANNPFAQKFGELLDFLGDKQKYETTMIKGLISNLAYAVIVAKDDTSSLESIETFKKKLLQIESDYQKKASSFVVPFKHRIDITPIK